MELFLSGILFGLSIAAPVGPIGLLCIRRTMQFGFLNGFISGLGAATADLVYGYLAVYGFHAASAFLTTYQTALTVIGSTLLFYLAWSTFREIPGHDLETGPEKHRKRAFFTTFLLTITNPLTILAFAAFLSSFSSVVAESKDGAGSLLAGVFFGSALWWAFLAGLTDRVNGLISFTTRIWINRFSGVLIFGFAVYSITTLFLEK